MKIVSDENIPYVEQAFGSIGETVVLPSSRINTDAIQDADILLVRSVTTVDHNLLDGSSVKIVASATIGIDHIDTEYLQSRDIRFAYAPGSNANSVAEYVMAALLHLATEKGFRLKNMTLGVVGVGNIGSKVVRMAEGLGIKVLQNDPPLARQTGESRFLPLDALMGADVITLHVPLTLEGEGATYHLFGTDRISKMKRGSILINTSRGPVVSGEALKAALGSEQLAGAVLDVWENEPEIDVALLQSVDLGSSHIAGYSLDGKVNGAAMIYQAVCTFLGLDATWDSAKAKPAPDIPFLALRVQKEIDEEILDRIVRQIYDIERDDASLRELMNVPADQQGKYFTRLRKEYPIRREFFNTELMMSEHQEELRGKIEALGFRFAENHSTARDER